MWQLMWRLAFETGMRQAERFALTPSDLTLTDGVPTIHVRHELRVYRPDAQVPAWLKARNISGNTWMVPPKSSRGERLVPVSRQLWDDLTAWAREHDVSADSLVFTLRGKPLDNHTERRRWLLTLDVAGLPHVTIRSARHYFATQLAIAGASENARKSILGHSEISTTTGYTHWDTKALAALTARTQLDDQTAA